MIEGLEDALGKAFPGSEEELLSLARLRSTSDSPFTSSRLDTDGVDTSSDRLRNLFKKIGSQRKGLEILSGTLGAGKGDLAMEYIFKFQPATMFSDCVDFIDIRRPIGFIITTDGDGAPTSMIPLENCLPSDATGIQTVCDTIPDDRIIVTDRIPYIDRDRRALDRWGGDWLIVQNDFPTSAGAANVRNPMELRWNGRSYRTAKVRYDKCWLIRFEDRVLSDEIRKDLKDNPSVDRRMLSNLERGAGLTDVITNQSYDIRAVMKMLDARRSIDSEMRRFASLMRADAELISDLESAIGYMTVCFVSLFIN